MLLFYIIDCTQMLKQLNCNELNDHQQQQQQQHEQMIKCNYHFSLLCFR